MRVCINTDAMLPLIGVKACAKNRILMKEVHGIIPQSYAILSGGIELLLILVIGHEHTLLDGGGNKALPAEQESGQADEQPSLPHQTEEEQADKNSGVSLSRVRKQQAIAAECHQAP